MKKKSKTEELPESYDEKNLSKAEEAFGNLLRFIKEKGKQESTPKEVK